MAYGDNLQSVAADDFESGSISGDWANGDGDFGTFSVTSGDAHPTSGASNSAIRRTAETFADDQYSEAISGGQSQGASAVCVRMQAGTDESHYQGNASNFTSSWRIVEVDASFNFMDLAESSTGWQLLSDGDLIRCEVEGTTIRFGGNIAGGGDGEFLSTTDATLTSGAPGLNAVGATNTNNLFASWEGGDISAGGGGATVPIFRHHYMVQKR